MRGICDLQKVISIIASGTYSTTEAVIKSTIKEVDELSKESNIQLVDMENKEHEAVTKLVTTKLEAHFDIPRFSKVRKLLRITAWIKSFVHNARNPESKTFGPLSIKELELAREY